MEFVEEMKNREVRPRSSENEGLKSYERRDYDFVLRTQLRRKVQFSECFNLGHGLTSDTTAWDSAMTPEGHGHQSTHPCPKTHRVGQPKQALTELSAGRGSTDLWRGLTDISRRGKGCIHYSGRFMSSDPEIRMSEGARYTFPGCCRKPSLNPRESDAHKLLPIPPPLEGQEAKERGREREAGNIYDVLRCARQEHISPTNSSLSSLGKILLGTRGANNLSRDSDNPPPRLLRQMVRREKGKGLGTAEERGKFMWGVPEVQPASLAIVSPRNDTVNEINNLIIQRVPGQVKTYKSIDTVANVDDVVHFPRNFLNSLNSSGLPPHELSLKVGTPIMLLRNISPPNMCNGTRLLIKDLKENLIVATILTDPAAGQLANIPRIPMIPTDLPIYFKRLQFPIKTSFAITINKSQDYFLSLSRSKFRLPNFLASKADRRSVQRTRQMTKASAAFKEPFQPCSRAVAMLRRRCQFTPQHSAHPTCSLRSRAGLVTALFLHPLFFSPANRPALARRTIEEDGAKQYSQQSRVPFRIGRLILLAAWGALLKRCNFAESFLATSCTSITSADTPVWETQLYKPRVEGQVTETLISGVGMNALIHDLIKTTERIGAVKTDFLSTKSRLPTMQNNFAGCFLAGANLNITVGPRFTNEVPRASMAEFWWRWGGDGMQWRRKREHLEKNPLANGNVRHNSQVMESVVDPSGIRTTDFAVAGDNSTCHTRVGLCGKCWSLVIGDSSRLAAISHSATSLRVVMRRALCSKTSKQLAKSKTSIVPVTTKRTGHTPKSDMNTVVAGDKYYDSPLPSWYSKTAVEEITEANMEFCTLCLPRRVQVIGTRRADLTMRQFLNHMSKGKRTGKKKTVACGSGIITMKQKSYPLNSVGSFRVCASGSLSLMKEMNNRWESSFEIVNCQREPTEGEKEFHVSSSPFSDPPLEIVLVVDVVYERHGVQWSGDVWTALTARSGEPMMRRIAWAEYTGDTREISLTSGIVRHDSHVRFSTRQIEVTSSFNVQEASQNNARYDDVDLKLRISDCGGLREFNGGENASSSRKTTGKLQRPQTDLPWCSRSVRHRSGVREALGSNPGYGMTPSPAKFSSIKHSTRPFGVWWAAWLPDHRGPRTYVHYGSSDGTHIDVDARLGEDLGGGRLLGHVAIELLVATVPLDGVERRVLQVVVAGQLDRVSSPHSLGHADPHAFQHFHACNTRHSPRSDHDAKGASVAERLAYSTPTKGELGSMPCWVTPGFSQVTIFLDDAVDRRVFSGISRFPRLYIPALLHSHLISPLLAANISEPYRLTILKLTPLHPRLTPPHPRLTPPHPRLTPPMNNTGEGLEENQLINQCETLVRKAELKLLEARAKKIVSRARGLEAFSGMSHLILKAKKEDSGLRDRSSGPGRISGPGPFHWPTIQPLPRPLPAACTPHPHLTTLVSMNWSDCGAYGADYGARGKDSGACGAIYGVCGADCGDDCGMCLVDFGDDCRACRADCCVGGTCITNCNACGVDCGADYNECDATNPQRSIPCLFGLCQSLASMVGPVGWMVSMTGTAISCGMLVMANGINSGGITPGFSHVGIVPVGGFSRGSSVSPALEFRRCSIFTSPSLALKTSMLRATQISPLHALPSVPIPFVALGTRGITGTRISMIDLTRAAVMLSILTPVPFLGRLNDLNSGCANFLGVSLPQHPGVTGANNLLGQHVASGPACTNCQDGVLDCTTRLTRGVVGVGIAGRRLKRGNQT
ncbi:hypothetical protein PR048_017022 [Dryococelus australis]|uniref:DNA helicase Pif1-like 2B domain-containing protein n=1 Tax=Dryococelus australis TaxID=614101 RepID=A0ABQ9H8E7_9NEOP|nr:hypothetical protein PR048_017022 [Dryococelus australis]